jgi:predicted neuraminidase
MHHVIRPWTSHLAGIVFAVLIVTTDASAEPPSTKADVFTKAPFPSAHASTLVEVKPGELLAAYFAGTDEGNKDVGIWLSRGSFSPGGMPTWQPPEQVAKDPRHPCWNPVLVQRPDGETILFHKAGASPREWAGLLKRSKDGGRTWGEAELLPAGLHGPIRAKPLALPDGTLVCGSSVENSLAWTGWVERTADAGRTWTRHGPIAVPGKPMGVIQPTIVRGKGNELIALLRSRGMERIVVSRSPDLGLTWSAGEVTDMPNPSAGVDAVNLPDGRIALIHNPSPNRRTPLVVSLGDEEARNFKTLATLEDQPGEYSYPALIVTADGRLQGTYTWNRQRIRHFALPVPSR